MKKVVLSNGLRVLVESIPTCRSVSFGIWVKAGSRHETPETNGFSHFIEHMLFKGTKRHTARQIADRFDGIGGNVNAFTSKEYTCYYAKVLDEHLPIAADMLADMFFESVFAEEELEKEKNVIIEEIAMYEDTPDDTVHDLVVRAAFGDDPLAFSVLGSAERLRAADADDLRGYMTRRYGVDTTVISIAGNVDESVKELLERHFGRFDRKAGEPKVTRPEFRSGSLFHRKSTEQNHLCLMFPGCAIDDPKLYAMILLNNVLGGGMSSRLFQEIREKRGLAYSVYSYHSAHSDVGTLTVYAGTAPKHTREVYELTLDLLGELSSGGLTEEELRRGKEQLKGNLILSLESTGSRMNRLGKNELMLGRHDTLDELLDKIESITLADVDDMIRRLMSKPCAIALVGAEESALDGIGREFVVSHSFQEVARQ